MVQKIESDAAADRVAGLKGPDRSQAPTAAAPEYPESTSDRERNKFRQSKFRRLTQVAVSDDDGSRIAEKTDALLQELIDETKKVQDFLQILTAEEPAVSPLTSFFDSAVTTTVRHITGAGNLYYLEVQNPNAADAWLQLFDANAPVLGTSLPKLSLYIPAQGATDKFWERGIEFKVAMRYAATTTATGSTAPTSNLVLNGGYV